MSEQKPKRKFLQFHLSTVVFALVLASILVGCIILEIRHEDETAQMAMDENVRRALRSDLHRAIPIICLCSGGPFFVAAMCFEWLIRRREALKT